MIGRASRSLSLNGLLLVVSLLSLFPFYIMFVMGTYFTEDLYKGIRLVPGTYWFANLDIVFRSKFWLFYWNSVYIAVTHTLLTVFTSAMAGYGLAKYRFSLQKAAFAFVVATMLLPSQLNLIGFIIEMKQFGWINTHLPLIIPAASSFGVFWMTVYIRSGVPGELLESAKMDGYSEFMTFVRIALPIIRPALGTLALLAFLSSWNNFMLPLIILNEPNLYTLPVGIKSFGNMFRLDLGVQLAALSLATIPILIVFAMFNKSLIRGITAGAVKG